jgi:hypothetical protein
MRKVVSTNPLVIVELKKVLIKSLHLGVWASQLPNGDWTTNYGTYSKSDIIVLW